MEVLRSRADAGCAVLMVTHEPRFAAWADRTVFIRDGRITDETGATDFDELFTCDGADDDDAGDARNSSQHNFRNNPGEQ